MFESLFKHTFKGGIYTYKMKHDTLKKKRDKGREGRDGRGRGEEKEERLQRSRCLCTTHGTP